jgi:sulfur transfer protein SufE
MADDGIDTGTEDIVPKGPNKVLAQMNKLKEANNKYKSLLKMAKDRISAQSEEMDALRGMNK